jgi:hypothetical protein
MLHHLPGRDRIRSSLLMAGSVIKEEQPLYIAICLALKDIDCAINLIKQRIAIKPSIVISASFEEDPSFPEMKDLLIHYL